MKAAFIGIVCTSFLLFACSDSAMETGHAESSAEGQNGKADGIEEQSVPTMDDGYVFTIESRLVLGSTDSEETTEVKAAVGGIAQVVQEGDSVAFTFTPCSIKLPEVDDRRLDITDETVGAIPAIDAVGQFGQSEDGYSLTIEPSAFIAGAELENELTDTLPTDKGDDRLVDMDQDDKWGITLKISGYSIYGSLRLIFSAVMQDIKGSLEWGGPADLSIDFFLVGDSVPFVNVQDKLDEALDELTVDEQDNQFRLLPLPEGTELSCEGVAQVIEEHLPTLESMTPTDSDD